MTMSRPYAYGMPARPAPAPAQPPTAAARPRPPAQRRQRRRGQWRPGARARPALPGGALRRLSTARLRAPGLSTRLRAPGYAPYPPYPGYPPQQLTMVHRPRRGLVTGGAVTFGVSWGIAASLSFIIGTCTGCNDGSVWTISGSRSQAR